MNTKKEKNAKELLFEIVEENNLQILAINCSYDYRFYKSKRYTEQGEITRLEDFSPNSYDYPYGVVYCKDKTTGEPIWLTAEEYDGIEFWWEIRRMPAFYDNLYEIKKLYNMTQSKSILELKRKALAMGLCGNYKGKWDGSTTPKELVDIASDVNGADFLCASVAKGWGLSKDFLLKNFGEYINGRYVARQEKGYTSEIYIGYKGEITARTTVLIVLYSNASVYVPKNHACKIFVARNANIGIQSDGICEFSDYTPGHEIKPGNFGHVSIIDPKKDKDSWINFGG